MQERLLNFPILKVHILSIRVKGWILISKCNQVELPGSTIKKSYVDCVGVFMRLANHI